MHNNHNVFNGFFSSHAITSDISVPETAKAAELFLSDGVIVSGLATGVPTDPLEVKGQCYNTLSVKI